MKIMPGESPNRRSIAVQASSSLRAVGHEAKLLPQRSPSRRTAPFESPTRVLGARVAHPRSSPFRRTTLHVGLEVAPEAESHALVPAQRPDLTDCPTVVPISFDCQRSTTFKEPVSNSLVGHEAQILNPVGSGRRSAASLREHRSKARSRRGEEGINVPDSRSQSRNSRSTNAAASNCNEVLGLIPCAPWILHFARDVVKGSAFDEQVRGQLRTSGQAYKLGHPLDIVDVGTYAKLCSASAHDLVKAIGNRLQNVKVHKKPCEHLFNYLKRIDELLSSVFRNSDMANTSHGVIRLLGMLKESLADAYVLFKRCESRTPIHVNILSNIPANFTAIEEEIQRIIPVLRLALAQHQDVLTSQANMERVAHSISTENSLAVSTTPTSVASSETSADAKYSKEEPKVSTQKSGQDRPAPVMSTACTLWHVDIHPLKMHSWGTRTYLCRACHQRGNGCAFSCAQCNYHVHPSCVELNEAIQQLEEIRVNKLITCDDSVNFDRDLCGLVR